MRINNNLQAINTHRQMRGIHVSQSKSMEKLSSGYRINRAGDDAAGLAISEKMRGQIRGLNQASRNAQDGISLIQTAEGALAETQNILQRMRQLAVQSVNDTNVDADRQAIQNEIDQLTQEIDRVSTTTEFNTKKLLDGSFQGKLQIGANETQTIKVEIQGMNTVGLGLTGGMEVSANAQTTDVSAFLSDGTYTVNEAGDRLLDQSGTEVGTVAGGAITLADGSTTVTFADNLAAGDTVTVSENGMKEVVTKEVVAGQENTLAAGTYTVSGTNFMKDGQLIGTYATGTVTFTDGSGRADLDIAATFGVTAPGDGDSFTVHGVNLSNREDAEGSIGALDEANNRVSAQRAKLGAIQNRLEHTIANDETSAENLQASESRIRDVDMAKEMMEFTKNNILSQAAQAMLVQANQAPQNVLQLLR